jgi:class 3 adenylate cyclase/predicted ATPase
MDLGGWLRSLGLGKYEAAFRENEIDEAVLPGLTAEDLKELGVAALGHRRKLLEAIAALRSDTNLRTTATRGPAAADESTRDTAERRQVTVMFSDLVGSTALSARMDPEDLREVISGYQKCVAETVGRFGGFVAKYLGDGVLIYFGYPQAHEDDAERAVRAGLELVAAVGDLKTHAALQTRVGIATGLVVVGELIGSGGSQEQAIVGETPNLAARLQGLAEPSSVVIADSTRKLVGNLFELEDLGASALKGIAAPVQAWAALRPASVESRFEAFHASGLTDLVGRQEELELLLRRWSKAKTGQGQVVLLSGEAGIGKSRLTAGFMEGLTNEPHTRLRYFCSPQHTDSAFYPIIGQMERAAHLAHDDSLAAKLDKLDALLAESSTSKEAAAVLAELLSLSNDGRYPALDLNPQQRRQKTIESLLRQMEMLTRSSPVLMIFEDAHWSDPSSLEVLGRTIDRIATIRALLIVTFRPEFNPPWIGRSHVTALTLNRLGIREVAVIIDRMIGNNEVPPNIRQDILDRTDGVPLFVEEMTKAVLEARDEGEARQTAAAIPARTLAVPATLHASLMARLDRLGSAKAVAQVGAAIGREFSHALLASVTGQSEADLHSAIDRLIAAGLLFQQGMPPHATYLFKHVLVQDAAYGTLLREPRRALHAQIADALESQFPDIVETQPELLARHCTDAGMSEKAAALWGKAGQLSLERSALAEAVQQFRRALDLIAALPGTAALRREQIRLQVALLNPLVHVKGFAAPETKAAAERARLLIEQAESLGEPPQDPLLWFSVLHAFYTQNFVSHPGGIASRELATQFLTLAERQGTGIPLMIGHRMMGTSLLTTGAFTGSRTHFDQALALYDPVAHRSVAARFGQDTRVVILTWRSLSLWYLGYPTAALIDARQGVSHAREISQASSLMFALTGATQTHIVCGRCEIAEAYIKELVALAEEKRSSWKWFGVVYQGLLSALNGEAADAVQMITAGVSALQSTGTTLFVPWFLAALARAYARLGRFDDAWGSFDKAIETLETGQETQWEAEVNRIGGEIALMSSEPRVTKAEAYFDRALAVAREQQAKSWELRAAMSMARLWGDQGKPQQARALLAPVYGWFTEGFDTLDLQEAKALLATLA